MRLWRNAVLAGHCLAVPASSVGDERGSRAHLRPTSLRPHLRRTHQPPLAPGLGESTIQDGRAHVQGHSLNCAVIPESTGSCHQSAWSTFPPLCSDQSSAGAVRETVYRRRLGLPGRRTHHLEQPAGQRTISPVSVNLPSAFCGGRGRALTMGTGCLGHLRVLLYFAQIVGPLRVCSGSPKRVTYGCFSTI